MIEKHYTVDKALPGSPDHHLSADPAELEALVGGIRTIEKALGKAVKGLEPLERDAFLYARRSVTSATRIPAGPRSRAPCSPTSAPAPASARASSTWWSAASRAWTSPRTPRSPGTWCDGLKDGLRVVAVVPARGGTDRVPYLNIKRLGDQPLLAHTLEAARGAACLDRVVVSTDDPRVAGVARAAGAEVPFLRPRELAGDIPSLKPVIVHAVRELEQAGERVDVVLVLQPTSPFRGAAAIDAAVERLLAGATTRSSR